jgi:hypothetical protein
MGQNSVLPTCWTSEIRFLIDKKTFSFFVCISRPTVRPTESTISLVHVALKLQREADDSSVPSAEVYTVWKLTIALTIHLHVVDLRQEGTNLFYG